MTCRLYVGIELALIFDELLHELIRNHNFSELSLHLNAHAIPTFHPHIYIFCCEMWFLIRLVDVFKSFRCQLLRLLTFILVMLVVRKLILRRHIHHQINVSVRQILETQRTRTVLHFTHHFQVDWHSRQHIYCLKILSDHGSEVKMNNFTVSRQFTNVYQLFLDRDVCKVEQFIHIVFNLDIRNSSGITHLFQPHFKPIINLILLHRTWSHI